MSKLGGGSFRSVNAWSCAAAFATIASVTTAATAQVADYPNKPVTIVTPFGAGSGPDTVLRIVGEKLGRIWNQRVVVDNKPGGGGFIAIEQAKRAAPDGYTLLQLDSEHLAALPHLYKQRNFVPFESFDPVAGLFRTPFLIAVPAQSPWTSMNDLLAAAKVKPGVVNYGSWGVGSSGHLAAQQLEAQTGAGMQHIPFKDTSQLFASLGSGDVSWSFATIPSSQGIYKAGKLRYIAVATSKRIPQMPDVPTVSESGGPPNFEVISFVTLVAPKGVPQATLVKINSDIATVLRDPEVRARFDTFAFEPAIWSSDEIRAQTAAKSTVYGQLVQRGSIYLD